MASKDFVYITLMLITPVVLLVSNDGKFAVLVHSDGKDNHVTRLIVIVCSDDGTLSLEVPLIPIIHTLAILTENFSKLFLLSVLNLLHTVIDGVIFQPCVANGMGLLAIFFIDTEIMKLHWHIVCKSSSSISARVQGLNCLSCSILKIPSPYSLAS